MKTKDSTLSTGKHSSDKKKKLYQQPKILSVEKLEVVAATCDGSKAVADFGSPCGEPLLLNS